MGKINSRQKGARGERELAALLTSLGIPARRGQQFSGLEGKDVVCDFDVPLHVECKRTETLSVYKAVAQCERDAAENEIAFVAHRRSNQKWLAIVDLQIFVKMLHSLSESRKNGMSVDDDTGILQLIG